MVLDVGPISYNPKDCQEWKYERDLRYLRKESKIIYHKTVLDSFDKGIDPDYR